MQQQQQQQQRRLMQITAASNQNNTQQQQSMDLEVAVPEDQRPVNELAALKQAWLYSWVSKQCDFVLQQLSEWFVMCQCCNGRGQWSTASDVATGSAEASDPQQVTLRQAVNSRCHALQLSTKHAVVQQTCTQCWHTCSCKPINIVQCFVLTLLAARVQAVLPLGDYVKRLALIFGFFFVFIGERCQQARLQISVPLAAVAAAHA
jgi:hypothetical protein